MTQEERDQIADSNWLEEKKKAGTPVTIEEIDQLWQDGVQELMEAERINKDLNGEDQYMQSKVLARIHIHLWELRDAAALAIRDKDMSYMAYKALQDQIKEK